LFIRIFLKERGSGRTKERGYFIFKLKHNLYETHYKLLNNNRINYMNNEYESMIALEDMCLISYLAVLEFPIENINSSKYPQFTFLFKKTKKLEEAMENFFNGSALVEPKEYWAKIRELKSRIKSIKN